MFSRLISEAPPAPERPARERFLHVLATALHTRTLSRLTLSRPTAADTDLDRVLARPVELRGQLHLQLVYRHTTKDITKNHLPEDALKVIDGLLGDTFRNAHLQTPTHEVQLSIKFKGGRDKSLMRTGRLPACAADPDSAPLAAGTADASPSPATPDYAHNRAKQRWLDAGRPWWQDLGVTQSGTQVVPSMARKWKQINRFVEIFAAAIDGTSLERAREVRAIDFGCGKGYLTFGLWEWLHQRGQQARVLGVELREPLVQLCNDSALRHGLEGLRFDAGDVRTYEPEPVDVMIALHACDTATDHAIHLGLRAGARVILCSPCCHKELRPQMRSPAPLRPLLQHGIHLGQEAEMVTDGLRALLLDAQGYDTQVFEFISLEHTNKNKMILAVKREQPDSAEHQQQVWAQIQGLKDFYGIRRHSLEDLLVAGGQAAASAASMSAASAEGASVGA